MKVAVPGRRSTVTATADGVRVVIPAQRHAFAILFLVAWLCGWAMGETFAARQVLFGEKGPADLFLVAWLVMWTIGGGWAAYSCLWLAFGREVVVLRSDALVLKNDVLGFGRAREYELLHVNHLRVTPQPSMPFGQSWSASPWRASTGAVAFDYGAKTIRFAAVEEAEAGQIVSELKARHSFSDRAA